MVTLFSRSAGHVTRIEGDMIPLAIGINLRKRSQNGELQQKTILDERAGFTNNLVNYLYLVVTQITFGEQDPTQFRSSLDEAIYGYINKVNMGDFQVAGVTFSSRCTDDTENNYVGGKATNISIIKGLYDEFKVSKAKMPAGISLNQAVIWAFLTGFQLGLTDPETGVCTFAFNFKTLPTR